MAAFTSSTQTAAARTCSRSGRRQWWGRPDGWSRTGLEDPAFSPDGSKIAYIDGMHDWGNGLRVMDADGSHVRVLLESDGELAVGIGLPGSPAWSPDGSRLAFCAPGGIWVIGADGLGLRKVIPNGENQSWSPDGSRIAYQVRDRVHYSLGPLGSRTQTVATFRSSPGVTPVLGIPSNRLAIRTA